MEAIWLWGKHSKIFQKYIINSDGSALKKTLAMCLLSPVKLTLMMRCVDADD